jgi:hypothetical protein
MLPACRRAVPELDYRGRKLARSDLDALVRVPMSGSLDEATLSVST